ncbi:hypothetical protein [Haemophilus haemolyticus]|uniref:hypothetical protein n=1 Tax=Haemophilus haemolyticus TaxID=726 RepID=UPI000E582C42|nr:hypothetical protein [Haemophilus haemolyticus]
MNKNKARLNNIKEQIFSFGNFRLIAFVLFFVGFSLTSSSLACDYRDDFKKLAKFDQQEGSFFARKARELRLEIDRIKFQKGVYENNKDRLIELAENQKKITIQIIRNLGNLDICNSDFLQIKNKQKEMFDISIKQSDLMIKMFSSPENFDELEKEKNILNSKGLEIQHELKLLILGLSRKYPN